MSGFQIAPEEVNIGDILRLALPLKTVVICGDGGAQRRRVQWVALLSASEELVDQARGGDLAVVPPAVQHQLTDAHFQKQLALLANKRVSGMLVFEPVSEQVSAAAAKANMPILVAPEGTSVRDVHRSIAALLVDRQTATRERGMQLYRKLSEMSREGQGLAAMTDVMANLTGKAIVIQDKRLEIQAVSRPASAGVDIESIVEVLSRRDQLPAVLRNRKAAAKARQSYWQQLLPIENMGRLISPIISGDRARGYLSVIGPADNLDLLDSLTVEHGAAACALEMAKAKAVSEAKKMLRGDFLEGLLAGTLPAKEIQRLAGRLDHDTKPAHAAMVFAWDGPDSPSLRRLETTVSWLLSNSAHPALVHVYGDQHVCVFQSLGTADDMQVVKDLSQRLRGQLEAEFPQLRLIGGTSGPARSLADWPAIYREAVQAMQLGQRLKLDQVVEFGSLGIYRLLGQLEEVPAVRLFTEQVISPLVTYDREHRSSLVQTIDAYFKHHGNISQTAESLFIHRNTLLYRLERIQELTKHDLNQSNMRLAMHLALKLWQLAPKA